DYRAFLLVHNGGVPRRNKFVHTSQQGQRRETWLKWIFSVGRAGLLDLGAEDVLTAYRERPQGLPAGLLPTASAWFVGNTGFVCVACAGPDTGKVFFRPWVEPERTTIYPVADSWTAFLEGLEFEAGAPRAWKLAIEVGNTSQLRKWLEKN